MRGSDIHLKTSTGLLHLPHLHSNLPYRHNVMDLILDKAGSSACTCYTLRNVLANAQHTTCSIAKVTTTRFVH